MRHTMLTIAALALTLLTSGALLAEGPNPDQLRAEAKQLIARGKELREAGKPDQADAHFAEAEQLIDKANEIARDRERGEGARRERGEGQRRERAEAERREIIERLEQIKREVDELREAGNGEEAEELIRHGKKLKQRIQQLSRGHEHHGERTLRS